MCRKFYDKVPQGKKRNQGRDLFHSQINSAATGKMEVNTPSIII